MVFRHNRQQVSLLQIPFSNYQDICDTQEGMNLLQCDCGTLCPLMDQISHRDKIIQASKKLNFELGWTITRAPPILPSVEIQRAAPFGGPWACSHGTALIAQCASEKDKHLIPRHKLGTTGLVLPTGEKVFGFYSIFLSSSDVWRLPSCSAVIFLLFGLSNLDHKLLSFFMS